MHVIIMELCTGGSLYDVIDSPENAYGLNESELKQVISDVGEYTHNHILDMDTSYMTWTPRT